MVSLQCLSVPRVSQCGMKEGSYGYKTHLVPRPRKTPKYAQISLKMLQSHSKNINITELNLLLKAASVAERLEHLGHDGERDSGGEDSDGV